MPKEMKPPRYLPQDAKPGTKIVSRGEYVGQTEGRYGPQFNFVELETGDHVVLGGRGMLWRVEQGHMAPGDVFDITFEGKDKMTKGDYKGKDVIKWKYEKYEDSELPADFLAKRGKLAAGAAVGAAGSPSPVGATQGIPQPVRTPESEALDDLS